MKVTNIQQSGSPPVGDGGDQYTGLDRFGLVIDQRWIKDSSGADLERVEYWRQGRSRSRVASVPSSFTKSYGTTVFQLNACHRVCFSLDEELEF